MVQPPESIENDYQSNTHSPWFPHPRNLFMGDWQIVKLNMGGGSTVIALRLSGHTAHALLV